MKKLTKEWGCWQIEGYVREKHTSGMVRAPDIRALAFSKGRKSMTAAHLGAKLRNSI